VPYRCEEAAEGQSGLDMISNLNPHCVLLDYSLPGHNGLEVLRRIRAQLPFLPVILMTGNGSEIIAARAIKDGASDYLTKSSISPETLHLGIKSAIEHGMTARALFEKDEQIRQQSRALEDSEERYRLLIDSVVDYAIYMLDADGNVKSWNRGAERISGYTAGEIIGRHFSVFYTDEDRTNDLPTRLLAVAADKGKYGSEGWGVRKDGSRFWASVVFDAVRNAKGELVGFAKVERDITERQRAQEALAASEARYRSLYNRTPAMMQSVDSDGRLVSVSDLWCQTLGYRREEALGQPAQAFMTLDSRERFIKTLLPDLKNKGPIIDAECQVVSADGCVHDVLFSAVVDGGEEGRNQAYLSVLADVTQKKALEAQLRQAQKMEAVGQLTGGIAHDFNNLLAVIIGNLDMVVGQVPKELRELVELALQASEKGAALTHRLLAYARKQTLRPREIELNTLVRDMEQLLRRTISGSVEIVLALGNDVAPVLADKEQLENALLNLAINARDAMPDGGRLTISTEHAATREDKAGSEGSQGSVEYAVLAVSDTGAGMSPDVLKRVTEPFFTTKETGKGSGLGLSMVDGFAKQSGGALLLESVVGQGTTVRILLPQVTASAASVERTDKPTLVEPRGRETVLVVEDAEDVRRLVVMQLQKLGYQVVEAADGPSAWIILEGPAEIDVLFTDIVMPGGLTGHKLAAEAKKLRPGLKTVFTSGFNGATADGGVSTNGDRILGKPYRRADLARFIREALDEDKKP
jgi:PAS domain S-box-containing protein